MTCREAIHALFTDESCVLTTSEVTERLYALYPDRPWKPNTIALHLPAFSVNHPTRRHHQSAWSRGFLYWLGDRRYRLWNPEQDGTWVVDKSGFRLAGEAEDSLEAEVLAEETLAEASLSLERDLEDCLVGNLHQLEPGLSLYESEGIRGQQLDTGVVGRLDLLAVDNEGDLVVIELKVGKADDKVCGQILRYIGWVKEQVAEGRRVRGIVVASDFSEGLRYAAQAIPDVTLKRYEFRFAFSEVR